MLFIVQCPCLNFSSFWLVKTSEKFSGESPGARGNDGVDHLLRLAHWGHLRGFVGAGPCGDWAVAAQRKFAPSQLEGGLAASILMEWMTFL